MNFSLNPRLYKKGDRIYDPETGQYQTIRATKSLKIRGAWRHFIRLDLGSTPESRWREQHEVYHSKPKDSDYADILF